MENFCYFLISSCTCHKQHEKFLIFIAVIFISATNIVNNTMYWRDNYPWKKRSYCKFSGTSIFLVEFFLPVVVSNTVQLYSAKPEIKYCGGWNGTHGVSVVCEGERLRKLFRLDIRYDAFSPSTISRKQFTNSAHLGTACNIMSQIHR